VRHIGLLLLISSPKIIFRWKNFTSKHLTQFNSRYWFCIAPSFTQLPTKPAVLPVIAKTMLRWNCRLRFTSCNRGSTQ